MAEQPKENKDKLGVLTKFFFPKKKEDGDESKFGPLTKFIFTIGKDFTSIIAIITLSIAGNVFVSLIFNSSDLETYAIILILISAIGLLWVGKLFMTYTTSFPDGIKLYNRDYDEFGKAPKQSEETYIKEQIKDRLNGTVFSGTLATTITLLPIILLAYKAYKLDELEVKTGYSPHTKESILSFSQFGEEQNLFDNQASFLQNFVANNGIDSSLIVSAICVNGKTLKIIDTLINDRKITINGCYETDETRELAIENGVKDDQLMQVSWDKLDQFYDINTINVLCLFNNSIPELNSTNDLEKLLKNYFNLLSKNSYLILDFENTEYSNGSITPPNGQGIKRIREDKINSEYYYVSFTEIDIKQNPIKEKSLSKPRRHLKKLSDKSFLQNSLHRAGFSKIAFERFEGYPFEFIVAFKE